MGYREYPIERDHELEAKIFERAGSFWADVIEGRPPAPRTLDDAKLLWPVSRVGSTIQASNEIVALDREMRILEQKAAELQALIEACEVQIKAFVGDHEELLHGKQCLRSWKSQQERRVGVTRLKAEQAAIAAQYTVLSSKRVFRKHDIK